MELADILPKLVQQALKIWAGKNDNTFPKHVLIYRDGMCTDCQLDVLNEQEADKIVQAIDEIAKGITITYIVVQKRISGYKMLERLRENRVSICSFSLLFITAFGAVFEFSMGNYAVEGGGAGYNPFAFPIVNPTETR